MGVVVTFFILVAIFLMIGAILGWTSASKVSGIESTIHQLERRLLNLVMAVVTMLAATRLGSRDGYRVGSGFLLLVIAKIFLFDMAELEGLLRVASFMGLGLALLGLGWLYQRTSKQAP